MEGAGDSAEFLASEPTFLRRNDIGRGESDHWHGRTILTTRCKGDFMHLELTFGNDLLHLPSVRAFANTSLQQLPLDEKSIEAFNVIVEAATENAVVQAYPPGTSGMVTLSIVELHGKLEVAVRDYGMPRDVEALEEELQSAGQNARSRIAALAAEVADEVHWIAYGRDGKALRIVKWLHDDHVTATSSAERIERFADEPPVAPEQSYTFRRMRDDEADKFRS
ncbi:hypothetical protein KOR42_54420 [Thalassoglobus neptunius]|uniref:Histidine kinase/HSP90-like ATPase domain-containing protein n=2 Tax=Thalassoglobus neptunius TaxID=1938619 RepID=A0A5C5UVX9_9PLAN|nr:hypothetical protein KOR42_54420 [Thalassoglobus neptunius]